MWRGTCPHCGNVRARGDQCDECGRTLDPQDLVEPRCRLSGTTPSFENSDHFFLRLSAFRDRLLEWLQDKEYWRPNVLNFTKRYLEEALLDRAITRDITWGVPVPLDDYDDKRIYVWFEAVIGYLSASVQWASNRGAAGGLEGVVAQPGGQTLLFHRQGQYTVPHDDMAGDADGI